MPEVMLPRGDDEVRLHVDVPDNSLVVAQSKEPDPTRSWAELARSALNDPVGVRRIVEERLTRKRVAVITDDLARSTNAEETLPVVLGQLQEAGAAKSDITIITASGMHEPLDEAGLVRKLGREIVGEYRCVPHDVAAKDDIVLVGITPSGTPAWANRVVVEADYVVGINRIYPHETHGYEGGYKLILPGVSGFDTIARNHSLNCAPDYGGSLASPSRVDTDEVGATVGINFLLNFVVNASGKAIAAFAGEPTSVFRSGVVYGDEHVWGAEVGGPADVVVASPGSRGLIVGDIKESWTGLLWLYRTARLTEPGGTVIWVAPEDGVFEGGLDGEVADNDVLGGMSMSEFKAAISRLSFSEIVRLHEKRNWPMSDRDVTWRMRELRGEFLRKRRFEALSARNTILAVDPQVALEKALGRINAKSPKVVVLPEAMTTLGKSELYTRT